MSDPEIIVEPIEPGIFPGGVTVFRMWAAPGAMDAVLGDDGVWAIPTEDSE